MPVAAKTIARISERMGESARHYKPEAKTTTNIGGHDTIAASNIVVQPALLGIIPIFLLPAKPAPAPSALGFAGARRRSADDTAETRITLIIERMHRHVLLGDKIRQPFVVPIHQRV